MIIQGETRLVIILGSYAIKVPNFLKGYKQFLYGLLSNLQEVEYQNQSKYLLPVLFHLPFGLATVMPKANILKNNLDQKTYLKITTDIGIYPRVDHKPESFGKWKGNIYVIDYGTTI